MAGHTHHAHGAHGQHRQGEGVIAAVDRQPLTSAKQAQAAHFLGGAAGGLVGHHIGQIQQAGRGLRRQAATCTAGNVVKHQRQTRGSRGNGPEMGLQTFLGGAVVIRHHHQGAIGSEGGRLGRGLHRFGGAVAAATSQQGSPIAHRLLHGSEKGVLLGPAEGGGFAGGATEHEAIGTLPHQVVGQSGGQIEIHRAVRREGGDHRGDNAAERSLGTGRRADRGRGDGGQPSSSPQSSSAI